VCNHGSIPGKGNRFIPSAKLTRSPTQGVPYAFSPGVKLPCHEADHSPLSKVKHEWNFSSSVYLHGMHRYQFTLLYCRYVIRHSRMHMHLD
jgi:hypothetical protein